jgi:hypothetical protein
MQVTGFAETRAVVAAHLLPTHRAGRGNTQSINAVFHFSHSFSITIRQDFKTTPFDDTSRVRLPANEKEERVKIRLVVQFKMNRRKRDVRAKAQRRKGEGGRV